MRKLPVLVLFGCLLGLPAYAQTAAVPSHDDLPPAPAGYEWEPNPGLSDEFDGSALDSTKWNGNPTFWSGRPPSKFDGKNVSVSDGKLKLRSTPLVTDLSQVKDPMKDIWVASACVSSVGSSASYGYYEARIKASHVSLTSSFWFQGGGNEIDVVEQRGGATLDPGADMFMKMNTHKFLGDRDLSTPVNWKMPTSASADYHVYGVWWKDKRHATFFHDGKEVANVTFKADFTAPMTMFFDTEVFTWDGLPTLQSLRDDSKNTMLVDWVRSWTLKKGK
jgi:beta-glucanase (GH16 family)